MMLKKLGMATFVAAAAFAFALGSATTGEAKAKKAAAEEPATALPCVGDAPVCGAKGGMQFTYANACSAVKDGAKVVASHACGAKKMHKAAKHKAMKKPAMKKPAKKAAKKPAKKKM